jgi:hypothetical protein
MCELLRVPSSSISGPENPISKLLNPNSSIGGLPLHNNTTSLFTQSPLPFQSSFPQSYKYDNLPSTSCTTPSKPLCGTKADTLTGLSTDNTLVGTYEKPSIDQKSVAQSGKSNKTETEIKGTGFGSDRNCGDSKNSQNLPVATVPPVKPVIPATSNSLPKVEIRKESGFGSDRNCGDSKNSQNLPVAPVPPVKPVTPATSNSLPKVEIRKESGFESDRNCGDSKNSKNPPVVSVPSVPPVASVPPVTPPVTPSVPPVVSVPSVSPVVSAPPATPSVPPTLVVAGSGY